jgi:hypothetical protein
MKKSRLLNALTATLCLALFASLQGCKEGKEGPAGPAGNANVIQLTFGPKTHAGGEISFALTGITQEQLNQSAYFTYVNPSGAFWYSLPGTTSGGSKEYRTYVQAQASGAPLLYINRVAGSGSESFAATRVVVIPASVLNNVRLNIDMTNYLEVKNAFNLPD